MSAEQIAALGGRAVVISVRQYRQGPQFELFFCTHCAYHHTRVIPEQHRLHWNKDGKWSQLGAPLDEETASKFCRMLTVPTSADSLIVVVL